MEEIWVMELKIKKLIKKRIVASIIFFVTSSLSLLFIVLFILSNYKNITLQNISWVVIMGFAFLILLANGFTNLKDKQQDVLIDNVLSYETKYTDEELKLKAKMLKEDRRFKEVENNLNNSDDTTEMIQQIEENNLGENGTNNN